MGKNAKDRAEQWRREQLQRATYELAQGSIEIHNFVKMLKAGIIRAIYPGEENTVMV